MTENERFENAVDLIDVDFVKSWNEINELALKNHKKALEFVALCFYRGNYVVTDYQKALFWFGRIVQLFPNDGYFWGLIGDCYFNGYGVEKNHLTAIQHYLKAWENGNADAAADIGWIYALGEIEVHDDNKAATWFQRAADMGSVFGMYFLGHFYSEGYGNLPKNYKIAIHYLKKSADLGSLPAISYLFQNKCYGDKEIENELRIKLIEIANNGNSKAQYMLGSAYWYGTESDLGCGFEKNIESAKYWIELSAEQNYPEAIYFLGKQLLVSFDGFKVDYKRGVDLLIKATEYGVSSAYFDLYSHYRWTEIDNEKWLYWGQKSLEFGNKYLSFDLANEHYKGEIVKKDIKRAVELYKICIEDNLLPYLVKKSYFQLAKCYIEDQDLGYGKFNEILDFLKQSFEAAIEDKSLNIDIGEVEYYIAYLYETGFGQRKNLEEAYKHYLKSYEIGYVEAGVQLSLFSKNLLGMMKKGAN